jgi:hypothetical protein
VCSRPFVFFEQTAAPSRGPMYSLLHECRPYPPRQQGFANRKAGTSYTRLGLSDKQLARSVHDSTTSKAPEHGLKPTDCLWQRRKASVSISGLSRPRPKTTGQPADGLLWQPTRLPKAPSLYAQSESHHGMSMKISTLVPAAFSRAFVRLRAPCCSKVGQF